MRSFRNFLGTYPCDMLNFSLPKRCGIVVNTDEADEPGEHWVAIYREDNVPIYFDSFGLPPFKEAIAHYLNTISPQGWCYNTLCFQSIYQDTCGMHCIYFLISMFTTNSFDEYRTIFDMGSHRNDVFSKLLYKTTS